MAETPTFLATDRYAVVTGGNKGIGLGICRQLASHGVTVVLTARDPSKGLRALQTLKKGSDLTLSHRLHFHQLDVTDNASVSALADFVKSNFGKLDILVNNAGVIGALIDAEAFRPLFADPGAQVADEMLKQTITQTYELSKECIDTNYYGVKRMTEAFLPLLQTSDSPRIVNVSSSRGKLQFVGNEWAKRILNSNAENLTEEMVDEVVNVFLKEFQEGTYEAKGWPAAFSAYTISKAALNAYTRLQAKKHPAIAINCLCPGLVKTDIICGAGFLSAEEGAESPVQLALMPSGGPSGLFFHRKEVSSFE